ncbi:hypothetical protein EYF80_021260 [Liparis tanakae]|uniref:Uncharacterized protein n=1 Tax=Liparis tanakae TaxID=230148 RepID=A0A4Z2HT45_9TELE|nr:hypothetical protein EYF80_021260 [Liparis tanakae]
MAILWSLCRKTTTFWREVRTMAIILGLLQLCSSLLLVKERADHTVMVLSPQLFHVGGVLRQVFPLGGVGQHVDRSLGLLEPFEEGLQLPERHLQALELTVQMGVAESILFVYRNGADTDSQVTNGGTDAQRAWRESLAMTRVPNLVVGQLFGQGVARLLEEVVEASVVVPNQSVHLLPLLLPLVAVANHVIELLKPRLDPVLSAVPLAAHLLHLRQRHKDRKRPIVTLISSVSPTVTMFDLSICVMRRSQSASSVAVSLRSVGATVSGVCGLWW